MPPKITKAVIPAAGLGTRFLPQTMERNKNILVNPTFFGSIVIFLCLVSGFLFFQNQQIKSRLIALQNESIPTSQPNPTPTAEPTANWKSYTNTKYGFSIKYPAEWEINRQKTAGKLQATDEDLAVSGFISIYDPKSTTTKTGNVITFTAEFGFPDTETSTVAILPITCELLNEACREQIFPGQIPTDIINIRINDIDTIEAGDNLYFIHKGKVFMIGIETEDSFQELKLLRRQILETLQVES